MIRHHPDTYRFPLLGNILIYSVLMISHYM